MMTSEATSHDAQFERLDDRYVMTLNGERVGELVYVDHGDSIELPHTVIDPQLRGSGLGGKLVQTALDDIRDRGDQRVVPTCPFVARWIDQHQDYASLCTVVTR